ncbi:hypothetical protein FRC12_001630 [Ceratobasidium sp. 428]|nr:hypothetical protein FRC12_001630 [Ceratobasidium sp. 428]
MVMIGMFWPTWNETAANASTPASHYSPFFPFLPLFFFDPNTLSFFLSVTFAAPATFTIIAASAATASAASAASTTSATSASTARFTLFY